MHHLSSSPWSLFLATIISLNSYYQLLNPKQQAYFIQQLAIESASADSLWRLLDSIHLRVHARGDRSEPAHRDRTAIYKSDLDTFYGKYSLPSRMRIPNLMHDLPLMSAHLEGLCCVVLGMRSFSEGSKRPTLHCRPNYPLSTGSGRSSWHWFQYGLLNSLDSLNSPRDFRRTSVHRRSALLSVTP